MKSALAVMATGLGKTVYASHLAKDFLPRGRVMLLAHREELVDQGRNTLERVTGRDVDIERAEFWAQEGNPWAQCEIVASTIQSQNAGAGSKLRMERFDPNDFALLVVDEAHHATAKSYRQVIDYYRQNPDLCVLGLTATPDRTDEEALGQVFEEVAFEYGILDGINDGWLVPIEQQVVYVQDLDLSHVKSQAGDLNGKDLAAIMEFEANLHGIASPTLEIIGRRKALVFTASVAHAERLCEIFNRHERNVACWVHGGTPKDQRQQIMEAYRLGRHRILCNVGVATEGFDVPDIEVVVMARPTKSRCLYTQMCLDSETEILCRHGWRNLDTIRASDEVASFSMDDGRVEWQHPTDIINRQALPGERFYGIESRRLSICVTDQHDMVIQRRSGRQHLWSPWHKKTAAQCARTKGSFRVPAAGIYCPDRGVPLTDDELRFIGWFVTDGTLNRCNGVIAITQGEHQPWLRKIDECLQGCGFKYGRHVVSRIGAFRASSKCVIYTVSKGKPRGRDRHLRGWGDLEPYIDKDLAGPLLEMNERQLAIFLEACHLGDGAKQASPNQSWTRRSYHISTARRTFADRLQALCVTRGFACNISEHHWNKRPLYVLHIKHQAHRSLVAANAKSDRPAFHDLGPAKGRVWCVTVPFGAIVTRRHGKVAIVGNCGRGTRPLAGVVDGIEEARDRQLAIANSAKPTLLVLDFVGNAGKHKLIHAGDILGGRYSDEVIERAREIARREGKPKEVTGALEEAEREIASERAKMEEQARRQFIKARARYNVVKLNPFEVFEMDLVRENAWQRGKPATEKQIDFLRKHRVEEAVIEKLTLVHASQLIDRLIKRQKQGLCSYRQARILKQRHIDPTSVSFDEARRLIDQIAAREKWGKRKARAS